MQAPLADHERQRIIDLFLQGVSPQAEIARQVNRSEGAVNNVIGRFTREFGADDVQAMRTMAVSMKDAGITPEQCLYGLRMLQVLSRMGVATEESGDVNVVSLESFVSKVHRAAKDAGLPEDKIVEYAKQLFELAASEAIEPAAVPQYIESKLKEKKSVESESEKLVEQRNALEERRKKALQDAETTEADILQFIFVREELKKCGGRIDDVAKLASTLDNAKKLGYNVSRIAAKTSEIESFEKRRQGCIVTCDMFEKDIAELVKSRDSIKAEIESKSETLSVLKELEGMGVGMEELRILKDTVTGIVAAHEMVLPLSAEGKSGPRKKMDQKKAFKKFFADVDRHYDRLFGFDYAMEAVKKLRAEKDQLTAQMPPLTEYVNTLTQKVGELRSIVNKDMPPQIQKLDSFRQIVADAEKVFREISSTSIEDTRQKYAHYAEAIGFKLKGLHLIIRAHRGQTIYVEDLLEPVIYALDAIMPRLETEGHSGAHIKCMEAHQALRFLRYPRTDSYKSKGAAR